MKTDREILSKYDLTNKNLNALTEIILCAMNEHTDQFRKPEERQSRIDELAQAFNNRVRSIEPKEASPSAQQEFVKANPGMQHVEEFEYGKIVNVWNREDKVDFQPAKYRFFADGKHWVETCSADLVINFKNIEKIADSDLKEVEEPIPGDMVEYCPNRIAWEKGIYIAKWKEKFIVENKFGDVSEVYGIRLPQKSEVESKAKEFMGDMLPLKFTGFENTYVNWDEAKEKIIEAIKWGQANPDKK